jgi:hypothetical protein
LGQLALNPFAMKTPIYFLVIMFPIVLLSQTAVPTNLRAAFTFDQVSARNGFESTSLLFGIPVSPPELKGDPYLDTAWSTTNVVLYENERIIKNIFTRYDLLNNGLEVRLPNKMMFVPGDRIKAWATNKNGVTRNFVNGKDLTPTNSCFFEVLADGKIALLKRTLITIKKADYNQGLDMGTRDDKILKSHAYYYLKGKEIVPLPKKLKQLNQKLNELGIISSEENSIQFKSEPELIAVFDSFNKR